MLDKILSNYRINKLLKSSIKDIHNSLYQNDRIYKLDNTYLVTIINVKQNSDICKYLNECDSNNKVNADFNKANEGDFNINNIVTLLEDKYKLICKIYKHVNIYQIITLEIHINTENFSKHKELNNMINICNNIKEIDKLSLINAAEELTKELVEIDRIYKLHNKKLTTIIYTPNIATSDRPFYKCYVCNYLYSNLYTNNTNDFINNRMKQLIEYLQIHYEINIHKYTINYNNSNDNKGVPINIKIVLNIPPITNIDSVLSIKAILNNRYNALCLEEIKLLKKASNELINKLKQDSIYKLYSHTDNLIITTLHIHINDYFYKYLYADIYDYHSEKSLVTSQNNDKSINNKIKYLIKSIEQYIIIYSSHNHFDKLTQTIYSIDICINIEDIIQKTDKYPKIINSYYILKNNDKELLNAATEEVYKILISTDQKYTIAVKKDGYLEGSILNNHTSYFYKYLYSDIYYKNDISKYNYVIDELKRKYNIVIVDNKFSSVSNYIFLEITININLSPYYVNIYSALKTIDDNKLLDAAKELYQKLNNYQDNDNHHYQYDVINGIKRATIYLMPNDPITNYITGNKTISKYKVSKIFYELKDKHNIIVKNEYIYYNKSTLQPIYMLLYF